jgi:hypothetical protein
MIEIPLRACGYRSITCLILSFFLLQINRFSISRSVSADADSAAPSVHVFYLMTQNWGDVITDGIKECPNLRCAWSQSDSILKLEDKYRRVVSEITARNPTITAAVYNVHSLRKKFLASAPLNCAWRTNVTLATSEEATIRYHHLFNATFPNFNAFSTNNPNSAIQRIHSGAHLHSADFTKNMLNFSSLIKAGSFGKFIYDK